MQDGDRHQLSPVEGVGGSWQRAVSGEGFNPGLWPACSHSSGHDGLYQDLLNRSFPEVAICCGGLVQSVGRGSPFQI